MNTNKIEIYSFYRFIKIDNRKKLKLKIDRLLMDLNIKGTILIASEGINGSISGNPNDLNKIFKFLKRTLKIRKLSLKINYLNSHAFNKVKVRIKKEIVSLGIKNFKFKQKKNNNIHPKDWDKFINNDDVSCIDIRNIYEIAIGSFGDAINPKTKSFREFPEKFKKLNLHKNKAIAMYCTGGIRCEKASMYLKSKGYKKLYQLEGGILNYMDYKFRSNKKSYWKGECFVFDKRVTVNKYLKQGTYQQCYGCRRPITDEEFKSEKYKKGVHCPNCYYERTPEQFKSSSIRQFQINKSIAKNFY